MIKAVVWIFPLLFGFSVGAAEAPQFELLVAQEFPGDYDFEKTRVGGLSGVVWEPLSQTLWAVSDDRGRVNEPRVYGIELKPRSSDKEKSKAPLEFVFSKKIDLKIKTDGLSAAKLKELQQKNAVLDLEGISLLPWGNFLMVSEGDMNQKPRQQSRLIEFKKNGQYVRDYDLPADYLAEPTGRQTKGARNNFSFEGLSAAGNRIAWVLASEQGLVQDPIDAKNSKTRFLEFTQPEAWVLKPAREWFYPLSESDPPSAGLQIQGVSEILHVRGDEWWVLERSAQVSVKGLEFGASLFQVELTGNRDLKKTKILSLSDLKPLREGLYFQKNFEAMGWGPDLPDGRRSLILVSDNNLEKGTPTQFLLVAVRLPSREAL